AFVLLSYCPPHSRPLHSFPTRRSSDLPLLKHVGRRVHDAGVDVAELLEREQVGGVVRVAEDVGRGLVDGHRPGTRRRVGLLPRVHGQGFKAVALGVGHRLNLLYGGSQAAILCRRRTALLSTADGATGCQTVAQPSESWPDARASKKPLRRERHNVQTAFVVLHPPLISQEPKRVLQELAPLQQMSFR